jgi:dTDP-4-dehydrorhamnose reductase
MAEWATRHGAALVHFSTDYVFSGEGNVPYTETDAVAPLSVYGQSKLAGEQAVQSSGCPHFILRTSWVYGSRGHNFLRTILRLASERDELRIVDDQWGAPTWARSIADATACLIAAANSQGGDLSSRIQDRGGIFHLTSDGSTTWHGFARAILGLSGTAQRVRLVPIRSEEYPTPARRPGNSRLSGEKIEVNWGIRLPDWSESLRLCLADMPATGR